MTDVPSPRFEDEGSAAIPDHVNLLFTNVGDPLQQTIALPQDGNLWVGYEFADQPATLAEIRHQGGGTETIEPGFENEFTVAQFDFIVIQLATPDQPIKLGWTYV